MASWWPGPLERQIALRYLRGQRGTRSASLQTVVAIGGIAVGVMALIVVLGVMNGLRDDLRDRILVASPHLRVQTYGDGLSMPDWEIALPEIRAVEGVIAAAPEVHSQGMLINPSGCAVAARMAGIGPGIGSRKSIGIAAAVVVGSFPADALVADSLDGAVVVGARLAEQLVAAPGDVVRIVTPRSVQASRVTGTPM